MALVHEGLFITPSVDIKTKTQLDSLTVEAGTFYTNESITILGVTATNWSVITFSTELKSSLRCYSQIWINPADPGTLYVRTADSNAVAYSAFKKFIDADQIATNYAKSSNSNTEILLQSSQPSPVQGKTIIWIDTSV